VLGIAKNKVPTKGIGNKWHNLLKQN